MCVATGSEFIDVVLMEYRSLSDEDGVFMSLTCLDVEMSLVYDSAILLVKDVKTLGMAEVEKDDESWIAVTLVIDKDSFATAGREEDGESREVCCNLDAVDTLEALCA